MCYRVGKLCGGEEGDVGGVNLTRPDAMTVKTSNKETRNKEYKAIYRVK